MAMVDNCYHISFLQAVCYLSYVIPIAAVQTFVDIFFLRDEPFLHNFLYKFSNCPADI